MKIFVSFILFLILLPIFSPLVQAQAGSVTLNPTDDTYEWFDDGRYDFHGDEPQLKVSEIIYLAFLKFNLSTIPEGARGFTATLELYCCKVGLTVGTYPTYLILNNLWTEETVNGWNIPGSGDLFLDTETVGTAETWHYWIVTAAIENATLRNATEVSIMVGSAYGMAPSPWAYFNSMEAGKYIPKLTIVWTEVVPEIPPFLVLVIFMIATLLAVKVYKREHSVKVVSV